MNLLNNDGSTYNKWHIFNICFIISLIFLFTFTFHTIRSSQTVIYHNAFVNTLSTTLETTNFVEANLSESFICDNTSNNRFPISSTTQSNDSFDVYRRNNLIQYCNIVPIPRLNWSKTHQYTEQDIAFVIFTASKFYHNRAMATRDTWLSRITNYYFLSATPYPHLPVTVVSGAGEDYLSNIKKLFYGLQMIYQQQMNK